MKFLRKTTLFILIACFETAFTSLLAACDMPTGNSGSKTSSSATAVAGSYSKTGFRKKAEARLTCLRKIFLYNFQIRSSKSE
ncbi:MAG: hypothetical protein IJ811_02210 [Clostridia bacterium]|nr:hypothetical protein [Clostridia bacterium]